MKAIMIIDEKPKSCEECRYGRWHGTSCVIQESDTYRDENGLDEDCPFKPLPQHKEINFDDCMEIHNLKVGYNHCLDEILGEEDESNINS